MDLALCGLTDERFVQHFLHSFATARYGSRLTGNNVNNDSHASIMLHNNNELPPPLHLDVSHNNLTDQFLQQWLSALTLSSPAAGLDSTLGESSTATPAVAMALLSAHLLSLDISGNRFLESHSSSLQ